MASDASSDTDRKTRFWRVPLDALYDFTSLLAVYAIRTHGGQGWALSDGRPYPVQASIAGRASRFQLPPAERKDHVCSSLGGKPEFDH